MKRIHLLPIVLNLFDGAAAGGEGGATGGDGAAQQTAAPQVLYGTQPETSDGRPADQGKPEAKHDSPEDQRERRRRYKEAIGGEFKDLYTEDTQRIINKKVAELAPYRDKAEKYQTIIDALAYRYGIEDGDAEKIRKSLDGDIALWEEMADKEGISVDAYIQRRNTAIENKQLHEELNRRRAEENASRQIAIWNSEAAAVAQKFPGFDLAVEAQNPEFIAMLKSNVPMEHAYKVIHMDELMSGAVQQAAITTEQRVVNNIRAKGQRPAEAGLGANSAVVVKNDVSKLTKADRADIARRATRGEYITFT